LRFAIRSLSLALLLAAAGASAYGGERFDPKFLEGAEKEAAQWPLPKEPVEPPAAVKTTADSKSTAPAKTTAQTAAPAAEDPEPDDSHDMKPPKDGDSGGGNRWQLILPLVSGTALVIFMAVKSRTKAVHPAALDALRRDGAACRGVEKSLHDLKRCLRDALDRAGNAEPAAVDPVRHCLAAAARVEERARVERIDPPGEGESAPAVDIERLRRLNALMDEQQKDAQAASEALAAAGVSEFPGKGERLYYNLKSIEESLNERRKCFRF
jgi:hypothetical protein